MAALPLDPPTPASDTLIIVKKSVYKDLHDALLKGFNDTASDVDGKYKWETMANVAEQLLATELKPRCCHADQRAIQAALGLYQSK